ncbi:hypothetical protein Tco_0636677, partial [Tanacetum coccineum]
MLERVSSHTTAPVAKGAMISLPTPDEIVTAPKPGQPSKKRKSRKRYSKASSIAPKL